MNTASSTKGTGHPLGLTEVLMFIGGLIVVVGILAAILYVSAPRAVPPTGVSEPVKVSDAKDAHMIKEAFIAAANAKRAYAEQRRGEWEAAAISTAVELPKDHPRSEWAGGTAAIELPKDHPRGEWAGGIIPSSGETSKEFQPGEWMISDGITGKDSTQAEYKAVGTVLDPSTGQSAYQDQRRGEWTVLSSPTGEDSYQEQRTGEQNAGNRCYMLETKQAQALCLGIR